MIALHREEDGPAVDPVEWGDALLLDLIDTPPVQRLRRIRQLGLATRVYPSGEHSRFSHALGVMHLAKRILALLHRQDPHLFTPVERLAVKTAALLHDVGHGPFSHVFEHLHPAIGPHEAWGWRIITGDGDVREAVARHCRRLGLDEAVFWSTLRRVWLGESAGEGYDADGGGRAGGGRPVAGPSNHPQQVGRRPA
ncbi:MAG: HD domain-containing protein, partial [Magnetococcales bacterium]|nr:HD domain-containing protein [Magnetococcales bacterium]